MNSQKLKAKMVEHRISQRVLAKMLDINLVTLNHKINGSAKFNIDEIRKIIDILNLSGDEVMLIFFPDELTET